MARAMRHELDENHGKGDWKALEDVDLVDEVFYHSIKLALAMNAEGPHEAEVLEYAADVANSAMFCADQYGALDSTLLRPGHAEDYDAPWIWSLPGWKARSHGLVRELMGRSPGSRPRTNIIWAWLTFALRTARGMIK